MILNRYTSPFDHLFFSARRAFTDCASASWFTSTSVSLAGRKAALVLGCCLILLSAGIEASKAQTPEPEKNLQLLFYSAEGPSYFIVVEKKHQRLKLFQQNSGLQMIKEYTCATGENQGTKKASGDARTPEGIYHITEIYEDKRITVFGSRAFHLDYPNVFDTHAGRFGDGIFIHGTNKKLNPNSTNGCITLNNSDLDELAPYLAVNTVPIIILDTDSELALGDNLLLEKTNPRFAEILEKLSFTTDKIKIDDIKSLSALKRGEQLIISTSYKIFDDNLTQYNERKRAYLTQAPMGKWRTLFAFQSQDNAPTLLALRPTKNGLAAKTDDLAVKAAENSAKSSENTGKIVATPALKTLTALSKAPPPALKVAATTVKSEEPAAKSIRPVPPAKPPLDKSEELLSFIEKWRNAWVTKDIESYIHCYSPSFKSGTLTRDEWRTKKEGLNQKYKYISVYLQNIVIEWTANGANVTFQQTYKSDQLQTIGTKTLHLINKKNRWMIENEII